MSAPAPAPVPGISTGTVSTALSDALNGVNNSLTTEMTDFPEQPTTADMIELQRAFTNWSLMVSVITSSQKEVGEALRGAAQKI